MTPEDFLNQQNYLIEWMSKAVNDKERAAAWQMLQNLNTLWVQSGKPTPEGNRTVVLRKTRKKMTPVEKFDKKNSRREAIMAQRARSG